MIVEALSAIEFSFKRVKMIPFTVTSKLVQLLILYGLSEQFLKFSFARTQQCRQQKTALENSNTSIIYVDFHHDLG